MAISIHIPPNIPPRSLTVKGPLFYTPFNGVVQSLTIRKHAYTYSTFIYMSCHSNAVFSWRQCFPIAIRKNNFCDPLKFVFVLLNKVKEIHHRIIHRYCPCNDLLNTVHLKWTFPQPVHFVKMRKKIWSIYFLSVPILPTSGERSLCLSSIIKIIIIVIIVLFTYVLIW